MILDRLPKIAAIISLIFVLNACSMMNECANRGAKWGAIYGYIDTKKSEVGARMYAFAGRVIGSQYCD